MHTLRDQGIPTAEAENFTAAELLRGSSLERQHELEPELYHLEGLEGALYGRLTRVICTAFLE